MFHKTLAKHPIPHFFYLMRVVYFFLEIRKAKGEKAITKGGWVGGARVPLEIYIAI